MTPDEYVRAVLARYQVATGEGSPSQVAGAALYPRLAAWAGQFLLEVRYSGSYAKGTGVRGGADVDLFVSLAPNTPGSLADIYENLHGQIGTWGYAPRRQNVSLGLTHQGTSVDLVPARKQDNRTTDHSLYHRKTNGWRQTNVGQHVDLIRQSGRAEEIRAVKIWRNINRLEFPSFYLELTVINALSGKRVGPVADNVIAVLRYIATNLSSARVVDPANSNNILSDDLTRAEKQALEQKAITSYSQRQWENIIA